MNKKLHGLQIDSESANALPESSSYGTVIDSIGSIDAWSPQAGSAQWGHGRQLAQLSWGPDGNIAYLLHATLEAMGLSPGPKDRFVGRESVTALDCWHGTFRRAAMFMGINEQAGTQIVMNELGPAGPDDSARATGWFTARESADRSPACGQPNPDCVEFSWHEKSPLCTRPVRKRTVGPCSPE